MKRFLLLALMGAVASVPGGIAILLCGPSLPVVAMALVAVGWSMLGLLFLMGAGNSSDAG